MSFGKYVSMVAGVKIKYYMKVSVKRKNYGDRDVKD
jgi:hypothetical protein